MVKQKIYRFVRNLYLLPIADTLVYFGNAYKYYAKNKLFKKNHPDYQFPPYGLSYDAYGTCNYEEIYDSGKKMAILLLDIIRKKRSGTISVLEWGCGPARVLQHVAQLDQNIDGLIGTDYNKKTIQWCQKNIKNIEFKINNLTPPLDVPDHSIDVLFCVSVFTHLSEAQHDAWRDEILRVLKKDGVFVGTFHGEKCKNRLSSKELEDFNSGRLVVKGKVQEGRKHYLAYQSDKYMQTFLSKFNIIEKTDSPEIIQTIWTAVAP